MVQKFQTRSVLSKTCLKKADKVLIGGGMTYTFYKAQGIEIGNSLVEEDKLDVAKALLEKSKRQIDLAS